MEIEEAKKAAVVNRGNVYRLKSCIKRAIKGERLRIGFFGGSITQGSLSSSDKTCYAWLVYKWWADTFPQSVFDYINGGIGGTSSLYGVARVQKDVLAYNPDFVIVDFSVNDEPTDFFQETYEGVIRKLLQFHEIPVLLLHNVFYDTGKNAEKQHLEIGKYYGLPCISIRNSIYPMLLDGTYAAEEVTPDNLHPNDKGHQLLAFMITSFLDEIYKEVLEEKEIEPSLELGQPFTENTYENAALLQNTNIEPELSGFIKDIRLKKNMLDLFKDGWQGHRRGDKILFSVECSNLAVQYKKSVQGSAPVAELILDGKKEDAIYLDGKFEEDWGDCLYLESILYHGERKKHKVEITIVKEAEEDNVPFYLVAIICA